MTSTDDNLDPLADEFARLVRSGDVSGVAAFLAREGGFRSRLYEPLFNFDAPAIVHCAWHNDRAMIDVLLDAGADPNERSQWWAGGWHALDACGPELAAHLIRRGATPDICSAAHLGMTDKVADMLAVNPLLVYTRGGDGMTPLHVAANVEIAGLMLDNDADIDARDADHVSTPAQWAVKDRHAVCRFLIDNGAAEDPFMAAAIGDATGLGNALAADPDLISARVDSERFPCPGSTGGHMYQYHFGVNSTLLHAAGRYGQIETARLLLRAGADVNVRGGYDEATPLHIAAWHGEAAMAKFLVESGAEIDAESGVLHHNTPLGWAIVAGQADVVRVLIGCGARQRAHHLEDARDGLSGRFKPIAPGAAESARREIVAMLDNSARV